VEKQELTSVRDELFKPIVTEWVSKLLNNADVGDAKLNMDAVPDATEGHQGDAEGQSSSDTRISNNEISAVPDAMEEHRGGADVPKRSAGSVTIMRRCSSCKRVEPVCNFGNCKT
jgi:hypothetical protein